MSDKNLALSRQGSVLPLLHSFVHFCAGRIMIIITQNKEKEVEAEEEEAEEEEVEEEQEEEGEMVAEANNFYLQTNLYCEL